MDDQQIAILAIARKKNRLNDLGQPKVDNGIFPGIQHDPGPLPLGAEVSVPYYKNGSLLQSIYTQHGPLLTASPNDLRMNLGMRQPRGAEPMAQKNGMSGVGAFADPMQWVLQAQTWPSDRSAGLNYGEIATINAWLRNYGVPAFLTGQINGEGKDPRAAVQHLWTRWQNVTVPMREQMQYAMRMHLSAYGFDTGRGQSPYWHGFSIRWPNAQALDTNNIGYSMASKLQAIGTDAWLRYVAVMAIGRDLFAEELQQVGGVQPGLTDTVADTVLEGNAVAGEWQNIAGVWRWKGVDVLSRPINVSQPLYPKPQAAPGEIDAARARNTQFLMKLFSAPTVASAMATSLNTAIPRWLNLYRAMIAPMTNASPIASVPMTPQGYAAIVAAVFNVRGFDLRAMVGAANFDAAQRQLDNVAPLPTAPASAVAPEGVSGLDSLLPQGEWRQTAGQILQQAGQVLEGKVNVNKQEPVPDQNLAASNERFNAAPIGQSNGGLLAAAAAIGALMLL